MVNIEIQVNQEDLVKDPPTYIDFVETSNSKQSAPQKQEKALSPINIQSKEVALSESSHG